MSRLRVRFSSVSAHQSRGALMYLDMYEHSCNHSTDVHVDCRPARGPRATASASLVTLTRTRVGSSAVSVSHSLAPTPTVGNGLASVSDTTSVAPLSSDSDTATNSKGRWQTATLTRQLESPTNLGVLSATVFVEGGSDSVSLSHERPSNDDVTSLSVQHTHLGTLSHSVSRFAHASSTLLDGAVTT